MDGGQPARVASDASVQAVARLPSRELRLARRGLGDRAGRGSIRFEGEEGNRTPPIWVVRCRDARWRLLRFGGSCVGGVPPSAIAMPMMRVLKQILEFSVPGRWAVVVTAWAAPGRSAGAADPPIMPTAPIGRRPIMTIGGLAAIGAQPATALMDDRAQSLSASRPTSSSPDHGRGVGPETLGMADSHQPLTRSNVRMIERRDRRR
jgi:hypothetical protein